LQGSPQDIDAYGACFYSPISYLLPALAIKLIARPHATGLSYVSEAFYAARLVNLLLMAFAVSMFLIHAPGFRNLTLVLYSLPMAIQQTVSINQESMIFMLMFLMLILWWRVPSRGQLAMLLIPIGLLMVMKAVYGLMLGLWLCALIRLWTQERKAPAWWLFVLPLIPLYLAYRWGRMSSFWIYAFLPPGVNPDLQMAFLRAHPDHILLLLGRQFLALFGRGHMTGGWTSVLGVLGWAKYEIGDGAYALLGAAILVAIAADLLSSEPALAPVGQSWIDLAFSRILPMLSALALVPAIALVIDIIFTRVGHDQIGGVQGRYLHFPYFVALIFGLDWIKHAIAIDWRSPTIMRTSQALTTCCILFCVPAIWLSIRKILSVYWLP